MDEVIDKYTTYCKYFSDEFLSLNGLMWHSSSFIM